MQLSFNVVCMLIKGILDRRRLGPVMCGHFRTSHINRCVSLTHLIRALWEV